MKRKGGKTIGIGGDVNCLLVTCLLASYNANNCQGEVDNKAEEEEEGGEEKNGRGKYDDGIH